MNETTKNKKHLHNVKPGKVAKNSKLFHGF
jgi:hypothetical protein